MIPFDVDYVQAATAAEAIAAWSEATAEGKTPRYFGGGTEIVTMARDNKLAADVLIDYKRVPETRVGAVQRRAPGAARSTAADPADAGGAAIATDPGITDANPVASGRFGAALRLNEIADTGAFALLGHCAAGVADRTVRNSITLGGNIAGMLPYREAVLPFLLLDGTVTTAAPAATTVSGGDPPRAAAGAPGARGSRASAARGSSAPAAPTATNAAPPRIRTLPIIDLFDKRLRTDPGELLLSCEIDPGIVHGLEADGVTTGDRGWGPRQAWATGPRGGWFYLRRTKEPRLDYPLVTIVIAILDGAWRVALSGAFGYPLRAVAAEQVLNDARPDAGGRFDDAAIRDLAVTALDAEALSYREDMRGSREYRRQMTIDALATGIGRLARGEQ
ncbi:MAG: FAD binding domain-containing protein [Alkalispirochaeta sp.]